MLFRPISARYFHPCPHHIHPHFRMCADPAAGMPGALIGADCLKFFLSC
jgi:hypothetical protein